MRFYQLEAKKSAPTPEDPAAVVTFTQWFGTERDATITRNKLFQAGGLVGLKREQIIYPTDVPTDKAGLLKFLQQNVLHSAVVV